MMSWQLEIHTGLDHMVWNLCMECSFQWFSNFQNKILQNVKISEFLRYGRRKKLTCGTWWIVSYEYTLAWIIMLWNLCNYKWPWYIFVIKDYQVSYREHSQKFQKLKFLHLFVAVLQEAHFPKGISFKAEIISIWSESHFLI